MDLVHYSSQTAPGNSFARAVHPLNRPYKWMSFSEAVHMKGSNYA